MYNIFLYIFEPLPNIDSWSLLIVVKLNFPLVYKVSRARAEPERSVDGYGAGEVPSNEASLGS